MYQGLSPEGYYKVANCYLGFVVREKTNNLTACKFFLSLVINCTGCESYITQKQHLQNIVAIV